jgi:type I restriction enzyme S subunit
MSFLRYPEYKDSGVEWLGEVPGHWEVLPLKRDLAFLTSGSRGWAENYSDQGELFIRIANLTRDGINLDLTDIQRVAVPTGSEGARTKVQNGDVLFSITAYLGSVAVVPPGLEDSYVSQHIAMARLRQAKVCSKWVAYVALSTVGQTWFQTQSYGGTKIQLTLDDVRNLPLVVPPLPEQHAIAAFLDRGTARIDALIAEQEKLIALLKEKRQAVISHAVTKGLDPNLPMKDSGVEWLGMVPGHWGVKPIRMVANVVRGASPRPAGDARYFGGDATPWVTVAEITKDEEVYLTSTGSFLTAEGALHSNLFPRGTLIYSNSGATLGVPKIMQLDGCANDGVVAFKDLSAQVQPEFLYHYLGSITENIREKVKQGSGQPNLNTDIVKALQFGVPPLHEQQAIVNQISMLATQFGSLTTEATNAITLLQERRTALISAAVTGKIDVRGAVTSEAA